MRDSSDCGGVLAARGAHHLGISRSERASVPMQARYQSTDRMSVVCCTQPMTPREDAGAVRTTISLDTTDDSPS